MNLDGEFGQGWGEFLRVVTRDGAAQWQLRCPGCGAWADIDDEQLHGQVSVDHSAGEDEKGFASAGGCGFHEKRDWFTEALEDTGREP